MISDIFELAYLTMIIMNHLQSCFNNQKIVYIFYICEFVIRLKIAVLQLLPGADSHRVADAFDVEISTGDPETEMNYAYEAMVKSLANDSPLSEISVKPCEKMVDSLPFKSNFDDVEIDHQNEAEMVLKI